MFHLFYQSIVSLLHIHTTLLTVKILKKRKLFVLYSFVMQEGNVEVCFCVCSFWGVWGCFTDTNVICVGVVLVCVSYILLS